MVAIVAAQMLGGLGGGVFGRLFHDRDDYRQHYRERAGVGGILGHILDSREFDMFLGLLLVLICLNVVGDHLTSAPVTSCAILLMVGLHFEKYILGLDNTLINADNFHNYSFHAQRIIHDGEWYRLLTASFLHKGRRLQFFLTMTALNALCRCEATSYLPSWQYLLFLVSLVATSGIMYILALHKYKRSHMTSFTAGCSGVVFALKAFSNTYRAGGVMDMPLVGSMYSYKIPVPVPSFAQHFVELFLVTILFQEDSNFYANAGGIAAGYVFVALDMTLHVFDMRHPKATNASSYDYDYEYDYRRRTTKRISLGANIKFIADKIAPYTMENGVTLALLFVITILSYQLMFRNLPKAPAMVPSAHSVPREVDTSSQDNFASEGVYSQDSGIKGEERNTTTAASADGSKGAEDDYSMLSDDPIEQGDGPSVDSEAKTAAREDATSVDDEGVQNFPSDEFMQALQTVSGSNEKLSTIAKTLNTIILIVKNATTKGQKKGKEFDKYRQIRVSNRQIQKCNIVGAFDLISTLGFVVKEDFDGDKHFVYPRQETPYWIAVAIDAMTDKVNQIERPSGDSGVQSVRAARARYFEEAEKKKANKSKTPRVYAAGLGGGNSGSVFFRGGT